MAELSPAAQKILDSYAKGINDTPLLLEREALAAVLRALAAQREPLIEVLWASDILDIAAELENTND